MANPSKAKGTRAETAVVNWLQANGYPEAHRQTLSGSADRGDIRLSSSLPVIGEVKWTSSTATAAMVDGWIEETRTEAENADADIGFLIYNRQRCADVGRWRAAVAYDGADRSWPMVQWGNASGLLVVLRSRGYVHG